MSNKKKKQTSHKKAIHPRQTVTGLYLLLMFGIFPVFCTDGLFNVRHDRFYLFATLSLMLLAFWGLSIAAGDRKNAIGKLSVTDWAMLGFLAVCILSTIFSVDPEKALWGTGGRNNGLFLMAIYVGIYFVVSRNGRPGPVAFATLAIVSAFVSLVAVLNFFGLDPLKILVKLTPADRRVFFSTIGNKNLLSGYLCIIIPVLAVLFVEDSCKWLRMLSLSCLGVGFAALMAADSDSGLLGMGAFAAVFLLRYIRYPGKLKRFSLAWAVMLAFARLIKPITILGNLENKGMSQLLQLLVYDNVGLALLLGLALITALLYLLDKKKPGLTLPKAVPVVLLALLGTALLATVAVVIYLTLNPQLPLQGFWRHLRLEDSWGTNRGYMWRRSLDIFREYSLWSKLFGSGPDTFYFVFRPYFEELSKFWVSSTNAAHNEYLNYLITVGVLGAAAYCTALVSGVIQGFRRAKQEPMAAVFCAAVICYGVQALVSIAQPITTPLLIVFLALCAGRKKEPLKILVI